MFDGGLQTGDFLLGGFELGVEVGEGCLKGLCLCFEVGFAGGSCGRLLVSFLDVSAKFLDVAEGLTQRLAIFNEGQKVAVAGLFRAEGCELAPEVFPFVRRDFVMGLEWLEAGAEFVERGVDGGSLLFAFGEAGLKLCGLQ